MARSWRQLRSGSPEICRSLHGEWDTREKTTDRELRSRGLLHVGLEPGEPTTSYRQQLEHPRQRMGQQASHPLRDLVAPALPAQQGALLEIRTAVDARTGRVLRHGFLLGKGTPMLADPPFPTVAAAIPKRSGSVGHPADDLCAGRVQVVERLGIRFKSGCCG